MGALGSNPNYYTIYMGIDIGQAQDPIVIVVADPETRNEEIHYPVRFLKRLPLGLSYPLNHRGDKENLWKNLKVSPS